MFRPLIQHAVENVWCGPYQDNQVILAAHKITPPGGSLGRFSIMTRYLPLPTADKRYHVYQVGQLHPSIAGMLPDRPDWANATWILFKTAINELPLYADIYTDVGIQLPRFKTYYQYTRDNALIVAVELDNKFPVNYEQDQVYIRLYTNAYHESEEGTQLTELTYTNGRIIQNLSDITTFQSEVLVQKARPGWVNCYVNGFLVDNIDAGTCQIGDRVEYIYDASVKNVVTLTVGSLPIFESVLDNKFKYLLHYPKGNEPQIIEYQDDVDLYVVHPGVSTRFRGVFYHHNRQDSLRMVTHRDYAIPVDTYEYLASALSDQISETPLDLQALQIKLHVRHAGYRRPLIFDNNRIFEMYKMTDEQIMQAMTGVHASMDLWKAETLENSAYTKLMRVNYPQITMEMIQAGYGYNSISTIIGGTPLKTTIENDLSWADLPIGQFENVTVYEHDVDGTLIGLKYQAAEPHYHSTNLLVRMIETIYGEATARPDVRFGQDNIHLPDHHSYRVYKCHYIDGVPDENWVDITGSPEYSVVDNTLVWGDLDHDQFLMVRSNAKHLYREFDLLPIAGTLYFTLSEEQDRGDGYQQYVMGVPMGDLDVWLNGKALIKGLDYIVKFPMIYIVNKEHLIQPAGSTPQTIAYRFTGFCDSDLNFEPIDDFGFIDHGVLSNNNRYNVRDDRVMRMTVAGALKHRDDLIFSEFHQGVSVINATNGMPYQVKDIVVPLLDFTEEETYQMRTQSEAIDQMVEDYLSIKIPQPDRNAVSAIPNRWKLVSPFICHITNDLQSGQFNKAPLLNVLQDSDVIELCQPYIHLLEFDPVNEANQIDQRYVVIHPHQLQGVMDLDLYSYRFLLRVVKLFGNGLVQLSGHVAVTANGL